MNKKYFLAGALLMALGVVLGAMGAHALEAKLSAAHLASFETGVRYQVYHALALLVISGVADKLRFRRMQVGIQAMLLGLTLFSGSIYALTVGHLIDFPLGSYLWWVTPLGGVLLISAWVILATAVWPKNVPTHQNDRTA